MLNTDSFFHEDAQPLYFSIKNNSDVNKKIDIFRENNDPLIEIQYTSLSLTYHRFMLLMSTHPLHFNFLRIVSRDHRSWFKYHRFSKFNCKGRFLSQALFCPIFELETYQYQTGIVDVNIDIKMNPSCNEYILELAPNSSIDMYFMELPEDAKKIENYFNNIISHSIILQNESDEDKSIHLFNDKLHQQLIEKNDGLSIISMNPEGGKIDFNEIVSLLGSFNSIKLFLQPLDEKSWKDIYDKVKIKATDTNIQEKQFDLQLLKDESHPAIVAGTEEKITGQLQPIFDIKTDTDMLISSLYPVEVVVPAKTKIAVAFYKMKNQNDEV